MKTFSLFLSLLLVSSSFAKENKTQNLASIKNLKIVEFDEAQLVKAANSSFYRLTNKKSANLCLELADNTGKKIATYSTEIIAYVDQSGNINSFKIDFNWIQKCWNQAKEKQIPNTLKDLYILPVQKDLKIKNLKTSVAIEKIREQMSLGETIKATGDLMEAVGSGQIQ